jgi:hypothetical protein
MLMVSLALLRAAVLHRSVMMMHTPERREAVLMRLCDAGTMQLSFTRLAFEA